MLQKQAEKNYLCSLTDKRKTMKHTNPQVEQMTSFIVMDVLERANELQKQGVDVIHLEVGEPDFDVPACVAEAAKAAYDRHLTHYTHSLGDPELRREIAAFYQREYGVTVDPDCIVVTSGSSPSILLVLMLLCNSDSEVILSNPGYACYRNFVLAAQAKPVLVPLSEENGLQYDIEAIRKCVTPHTAGIFINSPMNPSGWNELNLRVNTTGADYTDKSIQKEYERIDFYSYLVHIVQRLMNPKAGGKRKGILVFTRFLKEAEQLTWSIPGCAIVSGDTPKSTRERILAAFKSGEIPVVANVGVLTTGFDYPELDTVVMARPTMSLAMWYQIVGRAIRPHPQKEVGWIVDLCGNIKRFGEVSDLRLVDGSNGKWAVYSKGRQLTNVRF